MAPGMLAGAARAWYRARSAGREGREEVTIQRVSFLWALGYGAARVGIGMHDLFFNAVAGFFLSGYGLSNMAIGFLANERSFVGSLLSPVVGALSDRTVTRLGRRRPFMLALVPWCILGFLVLLTHPPTWVVVAIFILEPLLLGLAVVPYQAMLPDRVAAEQRASVNGINVFLGMAGGMALLVAARQWWEAQQALVFVMVAASLGLGVLITLVSIREPAAPLEAAEPLPTDPRAYLGSVLQFREATKYVVSYLFFWVGIGGITPFITRFGHEELDIPQGETFVLLLAVLLATLLFAAPAGWLGDRFGKKRVTSWGLLAFALLILLGSQAQSVQQVVPLLALAGLAQAIPSVLAYPLFTELVPARRMGELTGLSTMVWSLAQPLGATAFGAVADQTGTLRSVLIGGGLALLVAWAVLQTVKMPDAPAAARSDD